MGHCARGEGACSSCSAAVGGEGAFSSYSCLSDARTQMGAGASGWCRGRAAWGSWEHTVQASTAGEAHFGGAACGGTGVRGTVR